MTHRRYLKNGRWKITEGWRPLYDHPHCHRNGWRYYRHYERRTAVGQPWQYVTGATVETGVGC